jgi:hypothetical protein
MGSLKSLPIELLLMIIPSESSQLILPFPILELTFLLKLTFLLNLTLPGGSISVTRAIVGGMAKVVWSYV